MSRHDTAAGWAGWFGKIPALGDFVRRGLPATFTQPWDEWLSQELSAAHAMLGDRWASAYEQAPVVCFSLGADVLDPNAWHGILLPSHDRVGREFPLTLAQSRPRQAGAPTRREWWVELMSVGRSALEAAWSADELDLALAHFFREHAQHAQPAPVSVLDGGSAWWLWSPAAMEPGTAHTFTGLPRGVVQRYGPS